MANAGHPPPLLRRNGCGVEPIGFDESGFPLGIVPDVVYEQVELPLEPGDVLGLTEAKDAAGDLYQMRRIIAQLSAGPNCVDSIGKELLRDVNHFASGASFSDDLTLICFGRQS